MFPQLYLQDTTLPNDGRRSATSQQCRLLLVATSCHFVHSANFMVTDILPEAVVLTDGECLASAAVSMAPWAAEWTSAISGIIQQLKWEDVVLVTDGFLRQGAINTKHFHKSELNKQQVGVIPIHVDPDSQTNTLHNLTYHVEVVLPTVAPTVRVFVVCASSTTTAAVLKQAKVLGLLDKYFYWLVVCGTGEPLHSSLTFLHDLQITLGLLQPLKITVTRGETTDSMQLSSCENNDISESFLKQEVLKRVFEKLSSDVTEKMSYVVENSLWETEAYDFELCSFGPLVRSRYVIVESPDSKYGAPEEDGSWNGMVGMVARGGEESGSRPHENAQLHCPNNLRQVEDNPHLYLTQEVDIGVGPYTISSIRETVVDFSVPFMEDGGGILTKKGNSGISILTGLSTFSGTIWLCVVATTVVMGFSLFVTGKYSPYSDVNMSQERRDTWTLGTCIIYVCGSVMMQGMDKHPTNVSARCVLACWWVFTLLILSVYTAKLASVLTVEVQGAKIDSLEDLLASSVKPLVVAGSIWDSFFKNPTTTTYKKIAERMTGAPEVATDADSLDFVSTGTYAFLHDVNSVKYLYSSDCQKLYLATSTFNNNGLGIILPKDAPYKDAIDTIILRLQEGGILENWRARWWFTDGHCTSQAAASVRDTSRLGVNNIGGMLLTYVAVAALSLLAFALQFCLKRSGLAGTLARAPCWVWSKVTGRDHHTAAPTDVEC
ncbi:hypothetical protein C0Q70_00177 [Pomacea canaliculata]|uniref:Ionotropic glutamate receptor C-terminal domain-containing protein n=1 Tax=Pomacea canaliculata TaxID=400727 RepID=A0A2T7PVY8_POMCA|nr:hypothetical protein C0Q70_00177 [Pomacea canaliculata]